MIAKLELDQDDFAALNKDLTEELENYDERDSDYDDEEDKEYGEDDEEDDF
jgi:hypothetical protein